MNGQMTSIWWVRRDLRLGDNPALTAAIQDGSHVIPVYILDPHLLDRPAEKRQAFLFEGLRVLDADLRKLGSRLIVRQGEPAVQLRRLVDESGASVVFAEGDVSPYARRRDAAIASEVNLQLVNGPWIHPPHAVAQPDGKPYRVFAPFRRAWLALPSSEHMLKAPKVLTPVPPLESLPVPDGPGSALFPAGEREARQRLQGFLDGLIDSYQADRNRLDLDGTSSLSPYLRFGMLSAREAVAGAKFASRSAPDARAKSGCDAWLDELIWRDFFLSILYHFPDVLDKAFKPAYQNIPWRDHDQDLEAWQAGHTGYPVVDAGMRQLAATGWMHNRARMITASFLVKHLLVNWQAGERWFMRQLIDGDPALNNGNWQWVAGTGSDAAPYFRIFNPTRQGQVNDPAGVYVRRWVPELATVSDRYLHRPWEMPAEIQRSCGVMIGKQYPAPLVEQDAARKRALQVYRRR